MRAEQVTKPVRTSLHYVPIYLQCHKRASLVEAKNAAQNCKNPANSNSAPQPSWACISHRGALGSVKISKVAALIDGIGLLAILCSISVRRS